MKTKTFTYGEQEFTIETGRIARQATSAVLVRTDSTMVLVTLVADKKAGVNPFFPLSVNYIEKTYATGRIPGGFFKREARPSEKEVLTSRLIDRSLRPLFPKEFRNEVQVICTVISSSKDYDPDIAAMLGASATLALSGLPVPAILGAARIGYRDGKGYILNPSYESLKQSRLDMVVAGTENAVLMVESEADQLSEDIMLGALDFAHREMSAAIRAIDELTSETGLTKWEWIPPYDKEDRLYQEVKQEIEPQLQQGFAIEDKQERQDALADAKEQMLEKHAAEEDADKEQELEFIFNSLAADLVRTQVLTTGRRIDGRDTKRVRPIAIEAGILPHSHGSVLFTRGETQAIVTATLGSKRNAQIIDALEGEYKQSFMLHYNFPPFSVGEISFIGSPKRREIGHGALARRALQSVLPVEDDFPYSLRVVSEITESNGSSSMATVCGASLALMDAGVPLKSAVAGIAMGLVKEGDNYVILTDIMGDEDHLGDMDFKVAGTENGVTALQMDIKIEGITTQIMREALNQAHEARIHVLDEMKKVLARSRPEISPLAPYMITMTINQDKVRDVIGKGGNVIRAIIEETRAEVDVEDNRVSIYGEDRDSAMAARKKIEDIVAEPEIGKVYDGKVARIAEFGAFVDLLSNSTGLLHISQIANERVNKVEDYLKVGQHVRVKVLEPREPGKIRLSMKDIVPV